MVLRSDGKGHRLVGLFGELLYLTSTRHCLRRLQAWVVVGKAARRHLGAARGLLVAMDIRGNPIRGIGSSVP